MLGPDRHSTLGNKRFKLTWYYLYSTHLSKLSENCPLDITPYQELPPTGYSECEVCLFGEFYLLKIISVNFIKQEISMCILRRLYILLNLNLLKYNKLDSECI